MVITAGNTGYAGPSIELEPQWSLARFRLDVAIYDCTGAALCIIALTTAALATRTHQPKLWAMLPGFGAERVLYVTSTLLLTRLTYMATAQGCARFFPGREK
jgi:hypothetical protein